MPSLSAKSRTPASPNPGCHGMGTGSKTRRAFETAENGSCDDARHIPRETSSGFHTQWKPRPVKSFTLTVANSVTPWWIKVRAVRAS